MNWMLLSPWPFSSIQSSNTQSRSLRAACLISRIMTIIFCMLTEAVAKFGPSPVTSERDRPRATTMSSFTSLTLSSTLRT